MNAKMILLLWLCAILNICLAITYDQRQTGDLNVQVDLKDLRIIALMKGNKEEYVDYDYAYDYSEMTIKPQNGTTPKPLNGTSTVSDTSQDNTTAATVVTEQTTFAITNNDSQSLNVIEVTSTYNESTTTVKTSETVMNVTTEVPVAASTNIVQMMSTKDVISSTTTIRPTPPACRKGFVMNQKGECELKLQGAGNALLKLVKLSQKLKLRRENRKNEDTPKNL